MAAQIPLQTAYILSIWLEVLLYGLYAGLFYASSYMIVKTGRFDTTPSRVLFIAMNAMYLIATLQIGVDLYRLLRGYVWLADQPGGPVAYFEDNARWDHVFIGVSYVSQSIIGDAISIYRCWLVWDNNYWIVAFPALMVAGSAVSGYVTCWLFTTVSNASIFSSRLNGWITALFSIELAQNIIITSLIAYRIWSKDKLFLFSIAGRPSLMPVVRIIIESAALYAVAQLILVILYASNNNVQFIVLESMTPIIGITFTSITVRLSLKRKAMTSRKSTTVSGQQLQQSIPMTVRITRTVDYDHEYGSPESGIMDGDKELEVFASKSRISLRPSEDISFRNV